MSALLHLIFGIPLFLLRTILPLGLAVVGVVQLRGVLKDKNYEPARILPAAIPLIAAVALWIIF